MVDWVGHFNVRRPDKQSKWQLLGWEEARKVMLKPRRGVVELLGQSMGIHWCEHDANGTRRWTSEMPVVRPLVIDACSASTLASALDAGAPAFALKNVFAAARHLAYLALVYGGDLASSNVRFKAFVLKVTRRDLFWGPPGCRDLG